MAYFSEFNFATAGGLFLYGTSFVMLLVPLLIFYFETRTRENASRLPAPTTITKLMIYPIKSCRGISLQSAKLLRTGLDLDRNWMFVNEDMNFLTIREHAIMTLINTTITEDDELVVDAKGLEPSAKFAISARPTLAWLEKNTELVKVKIWSTETDAWLYPKEMTAPFTKIFGHEVRLALKGPEPRVLGSNGAPKHLGRTEKTMFPDVMPVLMANDSSMAELNERLRAKEEKELSIERFRPNIIVAGSDPWYEDSWKTVRVGDDLTLDVTQRCGRCLVPNVDPSTGKKHAKEPWNTIMKYRRVDEGLPYKPCFGMLCAPRAEGDIAVGDSVSVTETTKSHKYIRGFS